MSAADSDAVNAAAAVPAVAAAEAGGSGGGLWGVSGVTILLHGALIFAAPRDPGILPEEADGAPPGTLWVVFSG